MVYRKESVDVQMVVGLGFHCQIDIRMQQCIVVMEQPIQSQTLLHHLAYAIQLYVDATLIGLHLVWMKVIGMLVNQAMPLTVQGIVQAGGGRAWASDPSVVSEGAMVECQVGQCAVAADWRIQCYLVCCVLHPVLASEDD